MKKYFLIISGLCFLFSCGEVPEKKETTESVKDSTAVNITGYWANIGIIGKIKEKGLGKVDFYCTEMTFDRDSVLIDSGFETYKLKYEVKDSTCTLYKAFQDKNLELRIETSDFMQFKDTALSKIHGNDFFNRGLPNGLRFKAMLNENLLVGTYYIYEKNKKTDKKVEFNRNGEIRGLPEFMSYQICYSGDCLSSPEVTANIITLKDKNAEDDDYLWEKDYSTNNLKIFSLEVAKPEIKGDRKVLKQILDLRP